MRLQTLQNDLGFSLYTVLSVCCRVATSEEKWSPRKISTKYVTVDIITATNQNS